MGKKKEMLKEDSESYKLAEKLFREIYGYDPEIIEGNPQHELIVAALQKGMVHGAKLQQERMYNEDEVRKIAKWAFELHRRNDLDDEELENEFIEKLNKSIELCKPTN